MTGKIRVLVVDDSLLFRKLLITELSKSNLIEIVGYAIDVFDAEKKVLHLHPDVITLDVEMPGGNGIDFLKRLLPTHPIPVILVSSLNISVFDALSAGAVDFIRKPQGTSLALPTFIRGLINKILVSSKATVRLHTNSAPTSKPIKVAPLSLGKNGIIAIGASTGGTEAVLEILQILPPNMPGIVVTQHMPPLFTNMYAKRINNLCQLEIKEAADKDPILPNQVLIAPGDQQMEVVKQGSNYYVHCYKGPRVNGHCPSVDVLFSSVAKIKKCPTVGIILTGMGYDGAKGLLEMRQNGAFTIGQDKDSCVVYGMPMAAHKLGAVCKQAPCKQIPTLLLNHLKNL